jgi:tetratricopeptide (TPR) repeat protein
VMSKKLWLILALSGLSVAGFGAVFAAIFSRGFTTEEKLRIAARWLDEGRWDVAGALAGQLESSASLQDNSTLHYVRGVSQLMRIIDDLDSYPNRIILSEVVQDLQTSRELGFPLGYRGKGNYYLGLCLFHTYRWDEAIDALNQSLADHPDSRSDSMRMIFAAHLRKPIPDVNAAQDILEQWTQMPGLSQRELARNRLAHSQLAMHQNDSTESQQWLAEIPRGIPEYFEARKWQAFNFIRQSERLARDSSTREELLTKAQRVLQRLIIAAETPQIIRRQSYYLTGRVLRYQQQYQEAISVFSGVRQQNPFSAEAIAAGLEEAEILLELERYSEVVGTTRQLLDGISDIRLYNEYWLPVDELRTRLIAVGDRLQKARKHELALELADQFMLAFPPNHALRLQATILTNWGSAIESEIGLGMSSAKEVMTNMFARAAEKYEELAALEMRSRDYLNIVWSAAENYQKSGKLNAAGRMLERYLLYESRSKRPRGLLALGKNFMALGNWQAALEPLQKCLEEYPTSPTSYEARFLAARVHAELNELEAAIDLLSSNLWDFELHPESPIWRDSFIELGNLIFELGSQLLAEAKRNPSKDWTENESKLQVSHAELSRAIDQLSESVQRYPNDPRFHQTRYLLARSYQLASELPRQTERSNSALSEPTKRQLKQKRDQLLEKAAGEYHQLHRSIAAQRSENSNSLSPSILRSAFFGEADVLFDLERYEEAIEAYRNAAGYYTNQPESLEALAQMAECYRRLGREADAQKTVRQAELVLERIPEERDEAFVAYTRGDRQHWRKVLGWLKDWN